MDQNRDSFHDCKSVFTRKKKFDGKSLKYLKKNSLPHCWTKYLIKNPNLRSNVEIKTIDQNYVCISILEIYFTKLKKIFKICLKSDQPKNHFSSKESSNILRTQSVCFFANFFHLGSCFNAP